MIVCSYLFCILALSVLRAVATPPAQVVLGNNEHRHAQSAAAAAHPAALQEPSETSIRD